MKKIGAIALGALLAFSLGLTAAAADVSGTWEMTSQGRRGERTMEISIVQDGEKITVTMPGRQGNDMTGEGTIQGNAIEWTITRETPRGEFTLTYKGTVDGDSMSGTVEMSGGMGGQGGMEWTATKKTS